MCNCIVKYSQSMSMQFSGGIPLNSWTDRICRTCITILTLGCIQFIAEFDVSDFWLRTGNKKTNLEAVPTGALLKTIGHIQLTFHGYGTKPTWSAQPPSLSERRLRHRRKIAAGSGSETATPTLELMLLPLQAATIGKMSGIIGTSWLIGPPFLYSHAQNPREFPSLIPWILCDLTSLPTPSSDWGRLSILK